MNVSMTWNGGVRSYSRTAVPKPASIGYCRTHAAAALIFKLVWENVRFRPVRTMLSILLIAVPVTLILTLIGLSNGFSEPAPAEHALNAGRTSLSRHGPVRRLGNRTKRRPSSLKYFALPVNRSMR